MVVAIKCVTNLRRDTLSDSPFFFFSVFQSHFGVLVTVVAEFLFFSESALSVSGARIYWSNHISFQCKQKKSIKNRFRKHSKLDACRAYRCGIG